MRWLLIALISLNVLLVCLAFYGVFGAVWIWQVGSSLPTWVPLFGSQSYLANVQAEEFNCSIAYGFLNYKIAYWSNTGQVFGPAIFDWTQFFILLLATIDVVALVYFLKPRIMRRFFQRN